MILAGSAQPDSIQEARTNALHYKGNNSHWSQSRAGEDTIRQEAASQAINKTIKMVEQALNVKFRRIGTPAENREEMIEELRGMLHP